MHQGGRKTGLWSSMHRWQRVLVVVLGGIILLVLLIQAIASPVATAIVNRRLKAMEGYVGEVERVNVALWRGTLEIHELVLRDRDHPDDEPVVHIPKISFTGATGPLFRGRLGGEALIENPTFTIVKRDDIEEPSEPMDEKIAEAREGVKRWQDELSNAFPMHMTRLELREGQVRFLDRTFEPAVDVGIQQLNIMGRNIHNLPEYKSPPTTIDITGVTSGSGRLEIHLEAEPMAQPLEFYSSFGIEELNLTELDAFMRAYAKVQVTEGTFSVYSEIDAGGGAYEGYVRPFFEELEFEPVRNDEKSLGRRILETVADATASLLENPETEQVATETPFEGTFDDNDADLWATFTNLLRNAFLDALRQGFSDEVPAE